MATVIDVAKEANVAPMTVSRVVNTPDKVKPATREKVLLAMEKLHYKPNSAAKNLVTKRTGVVDIYIPASLDLSNPFTMHFIAGISKTLSERMYSFLILRDLKTQHLCDGYIATGLLRKELSLLARYAKTNDKPLVLFGHTSLEDVDCIDVDNVQGAYIAVKRLIQAGHTQIAMVNVKEDKDYPLDRLEGYKKALKEAGITFKESLVTYSENNPSGGEEAAVGLFANEKSISAVFCTTDTLGIGLVRQLERMGKRVPSDVSVVGFDGLGHHLLSTPRITTVQQPIYEIGQLLAKALLERIEGRVDRIEKLVPPVLLEEESIAERI
jgi:LacI family transcriptional regulator